MEKRNEELGSSNITSLLIKFSTPAIIAMVTNALYNLVDTAVVGRGVGTLAIAGLAISFPIQMLGLAIGQTVGIGSASIVSRNIGAGDYEKAYKTAGNSFATAWVLGMMISVIGFIFMDSLLVLFGATEDILPYAREYMQIIFIGSPFFAFSVSSNNIARAEGSPFVAMTSMIIGTLLNIVLDPLFVFVLKMGIAGAAWATVISQFASFAFLTVYFVSGKSALHIRLHHLYVDFKILVEIFIIGAASLARQAAGSLLAVVLNNSLKIYGGTLYIAIFGVINRVMMFMFMPIFGVVQGAQPIIGYNYGAKKMMRVKKTLYVSSLVVTVMLTITWTVLQLFPGAVIGIFSEDANLIDKGIPIMRILNMFIPIIGLQIIGATYFQSVGKAIPAMFFSMARQILFFIPTVLLLPLFFKLQGVWLSFPVTDILSTVVTVIWVLREVRLLEKEHLEQQELKSA